jgi:RNA polymerase sigma factor (sigma-70 family)
MDHLTLTIHEGARTGAQIMGLDAHDAADAAQDVTLKVLKGTTHVRAEEANVYALVAGRNAGIELLRKRSTRLGRALSLSDKRTMKKAKRMADPGPDHRLPLFERLSKAMERLTPREHEVVTLTLRFSWDHEAVGAHLGMVPNTVSQRFKRALNRLRDLVQH